MSKNQKNRSARYNRPYDVPKAILIANGAIAVAIASWLQALMRSSDKLSPAHSEFVVWLLVALTIAVIGAATSVNQFVRISIFPALRMQSDRQIRRVKKILKSLDIRIDDARASIIRTISDSKGANAELISQIETIEHKMSKSDLVDVMSQISAMNEEYEQAQILRSRAFDIFAKERSEVADLQTDIVKSRSLIEKSLEHADVIGASCFTASSFVVLIGLWRAWIVS